MTICKYIYVFICNSYSNFKTKTLWFVLQVFSFGWSRIFQSDIFTLFGLCHHLLENQTSNNRLFFDGWNLNKLSSCQFIFISHLGYLILPTAGQYPVPVPQLILCILSVLPCPGLISCILQTSSLYFPPCPQADFTHPADSWLVLLQLSHS